MQTAVNLKKLVLSLILTLGSVAPVSRMHELTGLIWLHRDLALPLQCTGRVCRKFLRNVAVRRSRARTYRIPGM